LAALVQAQGWAPVTSFESATTATVFDRRAAEVGAAAFAAGLQLHELSPADTSLESLFLQLTADPGPPGVPAQGSGVAR
jgi:ABC-2 type transport system ATP-binding protein